MDLKRVAGPPMRISCIAAVLSLGMAHGAIVNAQTAVGGGSVPAQTWFSQILPSGAGHTAYTYTGTGGDVGKAAFLNNDATPFRNESLSTAPHYDKQRSVHFAGVESPLTSTELFIYNSLHLAEWGPLIQVPLAARAVVLPFKHNGTREITLSTSQVCAIFSGSLNNWAEIGAPAAAINIVYRQDASIVTEVLSRFLAAACPDMGFVVSKRFEAVVAGATGGGVPTNWLPVPDADAMATALKHDGVIGYMYANSEYSGDDPALVVSIDGKSPEPGNIQAAMAKLLLPDLGLGSADPRAWTVPDVMPAEAYPIVGATYLLVGQCYEQVGVAMQRLKPFLERAYDAPVPKEWVRLPNSVDNPGKSDWIDSIKHAFVDSDSPLAINASATCNNVRGRPMKNPG